jgi:crotonobetainyl-CoA:carnitine CoA-transferase CaiB-like acyl-CoA transferase
MALLDVQVAMCAALSMNYFVSGHAPGRAGNAAVNIMPYQTFAAADGSLVLAIGNDSQFTKFCEALGVPFASDPRFSTNAARVTNRGELLPLLAAELARRTVAEWVALLEPRGVPIGPIQDLAQVYEHPQVLARGMKAVVEHPLREQLPLVASPLKLAGSPTVAPTPPPMLGQHTHEVLRELLGLRDSELAALENAGVIG